MEISQHINNIFNSNTYIIEHKAFDYCYLIDIGDTDYLIEKSLNIKGIFLTHSHFDHIYGINKVIEKYHDCKIFTSEYGERALLDDRLNMSKYHEAPLTYCGKNVNVLYDNYKISLFPDVTLNVLATPGHCPSCLTYYTDNYIFTGDSYIPDIKVVTNLPKGNKIQAQESVEKIKALMGNRTICPGHGEMIITT
ncbi:MAG: MBL fold metallo-hydrolase [Bacteroidales bacterium]|nr:MBL fold metallo-hydrolase [Bacteroidales bacterium]